ncbi:hypothetical protein V8F33_009361, partial [Rhypophila sp. PSN 637]
DAEPEGIFFQNPPFSPWPPFGYIPADELELPVRAHIGCARHLWAYSRWTWFLGDETEVVDEMHANEDAWPELDRNINPSQVLPEYLPPLGYTPNNIASETAVGAIFRWSATEIEATGKDIYTHPWVDALADSDDEETKDSWGSGSIESSSRHVLEHVKGWVMGVEEKRDPNWTTNVDFQDMRWNAIIKGVILLLQRAWFLRTWIIQEVALARHAVVVSRDHHSEWNDFYRAISYPFDLGNFSATPPDSQASQQRPLDLLANFRIFQATDARDKVFGIYSLLSDEDLAQFTLEQDYDLYVITVYTRSAIDCVALDGSLDVLSLGGIMCPPEHSKLPTRVPDWSYKDRAKPLHPRFLAAMSLGDTTIATENDMTRIRSATKNSTPKFHVSGDQKVLIVLGYPPPIIGI